MEMITLAKNPTERKKSLHLSPKPLHNIVSPKADKFKTLGSPSAQHQYIIKSSDIPSSLTIRDLEYKHIIEKAYFKPYTNESISPIKSHKSTINGINENDTKDIVFLIDLLNNKKN
ncbi:hypothetical protein SteCoe_8811 [Stentor coeruleus]|uniref:Uncharacterized protein n=1 Tax=Stentor coeruleus TaxID=5963 RepID=A0A1R2CJG1_9CILI|nr:hypothetical protein SteCoe_8811 [Stentor coeruleus]